MDSRTRRRGANTVTVRPEAASPLHISRAALLFSLIAAIVAFVTQFTRSAMPFSPRSHSPPNPNITSISDLVQAVYDAPQKGQFFRSGCFSRRSLLCHTLQHISFVLDDVDVSDDGDSYVFRISKHRVHDMRRNIQMRRERMDGCTPWEYGTFFTKLDWFLLYFLPRTIASKLFSTNFTEGGFRRDRWGWCTETIPFNVHSAQPTSFERDNPSDENAPVFDPLHEFSQKSRVDDPPNDAKPEPEIEQGSREPAPEREITYQHNLVNYEVHQQANMMYAR